MTLKVGFIGLGNMGTPIALNLLRSGVELFVYNRTKEKATPLVNEGAKLLDSPRDLFEQATIVFSILANDQALLQVTEGSNGLLEGARPGCIHVSMSTVSPKLTRSLAEKHHAKGIDYLAAPVFGRPEVAAQRNLAIPLAGNENAKKQVEPLLQFIGKRVYDFGNDPGIASSVKLIGNFLILTIIEAIGETVAFAEKSGIQLDQWQKLLSESLFPCPLVQNYSGIIINQKFEPAGFKMLLGLKDIDLILRAAESIRVPMPIAAILHDRFLSGLAKHRDEMDWSAITLSALEEAGLEHGFTTQSTTESGEAKEKV